MITEATEEFLVGCESLVVWWILRRLKGSLDVGPSIPNEYFSESGPIFRQDEVSFRQSIHVSSRSPAHFDFIYKWCRKLDSSPSPSPEVRATATRSIDTGAALRPPIIRATFPAGGLRGKNSIGAIVERAAVNRARYSSRRRTALSGNFRSCRI